MTARYIAPIPSLWIRREREIDRARLTQFVVLSMLLHALAIALFGAPSGGSREGRAMWGALQVVIKGVQRETPAPPPSLPAPTPPLPAPPAPVPMEVPRVPEAKPPEPIEAPFVMPPLLDRIRPSELPPLMTVPPPSEIEPPPPVPKPEPAPIPAPLLQPMPTLPERATLPTPLEAPVIRIPAEAPPVALPLPQPLPAMPQVQPLPPLERMTLPPLERAPVETPALPAQAPAGPRAPAAPERAIAPPAATSAPQPAPAAPVEGTAPRKAEPGVRPSPFTRPGPAAPEGPSRPGERPPVTYDPTRSDGLDLEAIRKRAGQLDPGRRALLPFPLPPVEKPKSKLEKAIDNARKPDCRDAYKDLGLAAVVPLIANEFGEGTCRW